MDHSVNTSYSRFQVTISQKRSQFFGYNGEECRIQDLRKALQNELKENVAALSAEILETLLSKKGSAKYQRVLSEEESRELGLGDRTVVEIETDQKGNRFTVHIHSELSQNHDRRFLNRRSRDRGDTTLSYDTAQDREKWLWDQRSIELSGDPQIGIINAGFSQAYKENSTAVINITGYGPVPEEKMVKGQPDDYERVPTPALQSYRIVRLLEMLRDKPELIIAIDERKGAT